MSEPIDTMNKFLVASRGKEICIMRPPLSYISEDDALNLAAYLVSIVGDDDRWEEVLKAVQNT